MQRRMIGASSVPEIGLGCMNLSHAYGSPPDEKSALALLHAAHHLGVRHFDTAALYGFGSNELLLGKAFRDRRHDVHIASKCGMTGVDGKRVIDGRPDTLLRTVDEALQRLQTDYIDLYYLHRWDKQVPVEDSVGALARMVEQGKVGAIGLSEVSAATLRKAHAVHPVAALQTEYSLWTRNPELGVLDACRELGTAFVAFSPLARGFLPGSVVDVSSLEHNDIRGNMPRFQDPNLSENVLLQQRLAALALSAGCSSGQLALVWLLRQADHIIPIPGTRSIAHLRENIAAAELNLDKQVVAEADKIINHGTVKAPRYPAGIQAEVDTEEFPRMPES